MKLSQVLNVDPAGYWWACCMCEDSSGVFDSPEEAWRGFCLHADADHAVFYMPDMEFIR